MIRVIGVMLCAVVAAGAADGVPVEGLPTWEERTLYMLVNAARLDPVDYGASYVDGGNPIGSYSPRTPLIMHHDLNRAAHAHSVDMASCKRMSHTSCDGTTWDTRVKSYYGQSSMLMECVAEWYPTPIGALSMWLNSNMGHRDAVMTTEVCHIGCGHAVGDQDYWTLDFGEIRLSATSPFFGGSHWIPTATTVTFWVNWYTSSGTPPQTVRLVIDGQSVDLSVVLGSNGKGTYGISRLRAQQCRTYYFEATDSDGVTWRLPETGVYVSVGEGSCAEDYLANTKISPDSKGIKLPHGSAVKTVVSSNPAIYSLQGRLINRAGIPLSAGIAVTEARGSRNRLVVFPPSP